MATQTSRSRSKPARAKRSLLVAVETPLGRLSHTGRGKAPAISYRGNKLVVSDGDFDAPQALIDKGVVEVLGVHVKTGSKVARVKASKGTTMDVRGEAIVIGA